jgi:hypothetical protein
MSNCGHCGANLTPADMSQPTCRYCGTVLAHYARAAEKVAVVNALMGDANRNGIPDALEGMAQMGGAPMHMPPGGGHPVVIVHSAVVLGGGPLPPQTGGPVGAQGSFPWPNAPPGRYGAFGMPMPPAPRRSAALIVIAVVVMLAVGLTAGMLMFMLTVR